MRRDEFDELCKSAKPVSVSDDIRITFDNGVWVDINATTDYDCAILEFYSSIDEQKDNEEREARIKREREQQIKESERIKNIKSKYTPQQWAEIKSAFYRI